MANIKIILYNRRIAATLDITSEIGKTVFDILPITARFNRWGDELFFPLDLNMSLNFPVETVQVGDIAYSDRWKAFCIFYGKTPLSNRFEIIPNGPVEVIGRLDESASSLRQFLSGYFPRIKRKFFKLFSISSGFAATITLEKN